ncbi:MAG: hypothetical protein KAS32_11690, partial [Candidatus Peribacteraceae bacterium]|nr:hypothetical protein [Candidatus Peribacteraceae bacterium]
MRWGFALLAVLLMVLPSVSALDADSIFSVEPGGSYKCIYVNLPQDLGLSSLDSTTETVIEIDKVQSPWADMTYNKVVLEPGVMNKNPVCFYYSGKEEGEFSFYNIKMSSLSLGISNSISGGLCVSDYEDVDVGVDVGEGTDICAMLNQNADIIDLSFKEDITQAKPGDIVEKTLYITSYANLNIRLSIATSLQEDFGDPVVKTSPSNPMVKKTFKVKAPERDGEFEMTIMAQAEGCNLYACKKQKKTTLSVTEKGKEGFTVSAIPKNINLKDPEETILRVIISNYEESQEFTIEASSDPVTDIEPETKTVEVDKDEEITTVFKVMPREDDLYKINFKITTGKSEKLLTTYISLGELLTDAYRHSEDVERDSEPSLRDQIIAARDQFESSYDDSEYGEEFDEYEDFRNTLDDLKQTSENKPEDKPKPEPKEEPGFNWFIVIIPIVIVVAVLVFVAYKKA